MTRLQVTEALIETGLLLATAVERGEPGQLYAETYLAVHKRVKTMALARERHLRLPEPNDVRLSDREREVVALVREFNSDKAIAKKLGITSGTVKLHLRHARMKIGALDLPQPHSQQNAAQKEQGQTNRVFPNQ